MTKTIVVFLTEAATVADALDAAAAAARLPATIVAIPVGSDPRHGHAAPEETALQWLRESREGPFAARRAEIRAAFDSYAAAEAATGAATGVVWRDEPGDVAAAVATAAGAADLVVLAYPRHLDGRDALHEALFQTGRLVLLAPARARAVCVADRPVIGRHIAIGWKTGAPVERAVAAAADWLRRAERLTVLCVTRPETISYGRRAGEAMAALGLAAEVVDLPRSGASVGRQLVAAAAERGADSLLIGAFRHGEVWETLLGGVTRDVLAAAALPVFMRA
jgi:nucleotide-binding universal stress UspA family protein/type IV secretory pathway VirB2 component (pilin)